MEKASEVSIGVKFVDQNGLLLLGVYDCAAAAEALELGQLEAGFHFVPEGHTIVARRFVSV
jgi:hypothetical protein